MGAPMARNLLRGGFPLAVFDRDPARVALLVDAGARPASSPRAVAEASDVIVTMLPDAPDVERVALGPDGLAAGIRPDAVLVDMTTSDPATTRRIAAVFATRGAHVIDCPVGKTAEHAVSGTLTLMAGGDPGIVERCRPLLRCLGTDFFYCGPLGLGQAMKLTNNLLATTLLEASAECLVLGVKTGLRLDLMLAVMRTTMAWNHQLAIAMPARPLAGDFEPGFLLRLAHKDCRLALAMAADLGAAAPVGRATLAALEEALAEGLGARDVGALLKLREQAAGLEVRLPSPGRPAGVPPAGPAPGWDAVALDDADDVATALRDIAAGSVARVRAGTRGLEVAVRDAIPLGHKLALRDLPAGAAIRKYGEVVGEATVPVLAGAHVHVHNLASRRARPAP
jgi:3-hydroxyisobutyrate dehydrogenase-like beta-hydroxyacid dehydrogenase